MYGNRRKDRLCNLARVANRNTGAHRRLRCHSRCQEAPSLSFERLLRKESQLGMPQLAAALSITNMMNPHLFFLHPYESCSPATSSSDIINLEELLPQN